MLFARQQTFRICCPRRSVSKKCFSGVVFYTKLKIVTASMLDNISTKIHVHFLIVFSSAPTIERLVCSSVYCLRNISDHKRCFGSPPSGTSSFIFCQIIEQTIGVIPKNDLKRRRATFALRVMELSVYRFPSLVKVCEVTFIF